MSENNKELKGLCISRKKNRDIFLYTDNGKITIRVVEIRGDKVRLLIDAPESVAIERDDAKKTTISDKRKGGRE